MVLSERQAKIFEILVELDPKIAKDFKCGIESLEGNNSEKIVHSAHYLEKEINMSRLKIICSDKLKKIQSHCIRV